MNITRRTPILVTGWLWASLVVLFVAGCASGGPLAVPRSADTALESTFTPTTSAESAPVVLPTVTPTPEMVAFDPSGVTVTAQPVVDGLTAPLFVTHAGDGSGRLFIVEKGGAIRILADGELIDEPFLNISDRVNSSGNEQGLLGLAFPPGYEELGYFFVNYTDSTNATQISRFAVDDSDPNRADPLSEFSVLRIEQPARNHNGGMLAFGPDGYLWIGTGDGGGGNDVYGNGQNPATLLGKMLRIDVTSDPGQAYLIPPDNPWVDATWKGQDVRDEIWAIGLRNPWRYSFDRQTGDLWIGDVGQNLYEEIHMTPAGSLGGLNYGWPLMEGFDCRVAEGCDPNELVYPVVDYGRPGHCSVTGGYVYRGAQFPALAGVYLYGDYCSGVIWGTWYDETGNWATAELLASGITLSSFGEDEAGELYTTDLRTGTVAQIMAAP